VLISYSHDSPEHNDRVLELANRLRADGIDCAVDQYEKSPAEGWPAWMEHRIEEAHFVLVVCTETYRRRMEGTASAGVGHGVRWESLLLRQQLYDAGAVNERVIPILLGAAGGGSDSYHLAPYDPLSTGEGRRVRAALPPPHRTALDSEAAARACETATAPHTPTRRSATPGVAC